MMNFKNYSKTGNKGFTLLELLIVIAIIAILAVALVFILNPAETLSKARDAQRISDLSTLKTALGLYMVSVATPDLDAGIANFCLGNTNTAAQIGYSVPNAGAVNCVVDVAEGTDVVAASNFSTTDNCRHTATDAAASQIDGTGWIPVDLTAIVGGSPISNLPLDPVNTIGTIATPINTDLAYRYACQIAGDSTHPSNVFELNAVLESSTYGPGGIDDRSVKDGGDNDNYYEVGTSLRLIGAGSNF